MAKPSFARGLSVSILLAVGSTTFFGQSSESGPAPAFEVASIRQDAPGSMFNMAYARFSNNGYSASHTSVQSLIKDAYGVDSDQILGAPSWISADTFEIEARIDSDTAYKMSKLSEEQLKLAHRRMLQALLTNRFKLTLHQDSKELPIYVLVVAKGGPKIHQAKPGDDYTNGIKNSNGDPIGPHMVLMRLGGGRIASQGLLLGGLVNRLTGELGRKVIDRTGLTGNYDFTLEWDPSFDHATETEQPSGLSLFTALQEQLGLKLEATKGPVEMLVIDQIEKPTEN